MIFVTGRSGSAIVQCMLTGTLPAIRHPLLFPTERPVAGGGHNGSLPGFSRFKGTAGTYPSRLQDGTPSTQPPRVGPRQVSRVVVLRSIPSFFKARIQRYQALSQMQLIVLEAMYKYVHQDSKNFNTSTFFPFLLLQVLIILQTGCDTQTANHSLSLPDH